MVYGSHEWAHLDHLIMVVWPLSHLFLSASRKGTEIAKQTHRLRRPLIELDALIKFSWIKDSVSRRGTYYSHILEIGKAMGNEVGTGHRLQDAQIVATT